jgi:hypothetical protein
VDGAVYRHKVCATTPWRGRSIMHTRQLLPTLACLCALCAAGCDTVARLCGVDLEVAHVSDDAGYVELASVSTGTRVIASAKRVAVRKTERPDVTELDVEETHYVRGTTDVVYKGRLVFRCEGAQEICTRTAMAPTSGTRPRDLFREWPLKIGSRVKPAPQ